MAVAAILAVELAYILHETLPELGPSPGCYPRSLDACVQHPLPWLWLAFAALLLLTAVAILVRKRLGIALGFLTQAVILVGLARNLSLEVGWSLAEGSGWSGIASWYQDLLFTILALCAAVGPAVTLLTTMITTPAAGNLRFARVAALILGSQLVAVIAAALISFPAAFHGCDYTGPGGVIIPDSPGSCPDFANLDFGRLFVMGTPSALILLLVCIGVWFGRNWALLAGIVWQLMLVVVLIVLGATLWDETSQNYWYERFPVGTSPRWLAYALLIVVAAPTLAALFAARAGSVVSGHRSPALSNLRS